MRRTLGRVAFVLLEVVLLVAAPAAAWIGFQAVLDSSEGRAVDPVLDPTEPGFVANLEPTPTTLLLGLDPDGTLSWLVVLVLSGADDVGGSVLFVPVATVADLGDAGAMTLAEAYLLGGPPLVSQATADVLGTGFGDTELVDPARMGELLGPVSPLTIDNPDELPDLEPGSQALDGAAVAAYLTERLDEESDLARLVRHELVWNAWLDAVAASSDPDVVPGERAVGIGRFVRGIAAGPHLVETIPGEAVELPEAEPPDDEGGDDEETTADDEETTATSSPSVTTATTTSSPTAGSGGSTSATTGEATTTTTYLVDPDPPPPSSLVAREAYVVDPLEVQDFVEERVPFPVSAAPGDRPRVQVLDGVGADGLALAGGRDVVRGGGQVVQVGNADAFDATTSRVVYFDGGLGEEAAAIAQALGVDEAELSTDPNPNDLIDVIVVLGSDLASAYGLEPRD